MFFTEASPSRERSKHADRLSALESREVHLRRILLSGPVAAEDERQAVESKAHQVKRELHNECAKLMDEYAALRERLRGITSLHESQKVELGRLQAIVAQREVAVGQATAAAESDSISNQMTHSFYPRVPSDEHNESENAYLRHQVDQAEANVMAYRSRHSALMRSADEIASESTSLAERKSLVFVQVAALRRLRAQIDASTSNGDQSRHENVSKLKQYQELAERLRCERQKHKAVIRERAGIVAHLCQGFAARSKKIDGERRKLLVRMRGIAGDGGVLDAELERNNALRCSVFEIINNAATERTLLEEVTATLRDRVDDLSLNITAETVRGA